MKNWNLFLVLAMVAVIAAILAALFYTTSATYKGQEGHLVLDKYVGELNLNDAPYRVRVEEKIGENFLRRLVVIRSIETPGFSITGYDEGEGRFSYLSLFYGMEGLGDLESRYGLKSNHLEGQYIKNKGWEWGTDYFNSGYLENSEEEVVGLSDEILDSVLSKLHLAAYRVLGEDNHVAQHEWDPKQEKYMKVFDKRDN